MVQADPKCHESITNLVPDSFDPRILDPEVDNPLAKDIQIVTDALRELSHKKAAFQDNTNSLAVPTAPIGTVPTAAADTAAKGRPSPNLSAHPLNTLASGNTESRSPRDEDDHTETQQPSKTPNDPPESSSSKRISKGKRKSEAMVDKPAQTKRKKVKEDTVTPAEGATEVPGRTRRVYAQFIHVSRLFSHFFL